MQRVSSLLPTWDRHRSSTSSLSSHHTRKHSIDKVRGWADKIPSNRISTSSRLAKEAFWPTTLDKECEKAARIVKSFCTDGFSAPDERPGSPISSSSNHTPNQILKKIPPRIIQNAVGLAIFTSMRSGLWTSGSGGSGILIARKTDGTWSPPSALVLQTPSLGFVIGVDIYDCILVINNFTVLEAFARPKLTLGTDVLLSRGPLVMLGLLENDVTWADLSDSAISYVKAKGQFSEAKLEGTVLQERSDENERFYGMKLSVAKIMAGDINQSLPQLRPLTEVLKAAEGRVDYDMALVEALSSQPAPGDLTFEPSQTPVLSPIFGLPNANDPDPFGVLALEMAGIGIREAGSQLRPDSSQFEYHPSPTSSVFPKTKRGSVDTTMSRSNRGSYMSSKTAATEKSHFTDAHLQTYAPTPETTPSHSQSQSEDGNQAQSSDEVQDVKEPVEVDYTKIDISSLRMLSNFPDLDEPLLEAQPRPSISVASDNVDLPEQQHRDLEREHSPVLVVSQDDENKLDDEHDHDRDVEEEDDMDDDDDYDDFDDDDLDGDEEAVVFEVATAQTPARMAMNGSQAVQVKGAVVTIPKRLPPPLPLRSPARSSRRKSQMPDISNMMGSPLRQEFDPSEGPNTATPRASRSLEPSDVPEVTEAELGHAVANHEAVVKEISVNPIQPREDPEVKSSELGEQTPKRESIPNRTMLCMNEQAVNGSGDVVAVIAA